MRRPARAPASLAPADCRYPVPRPGFLGLWSREARIPLPLTSIEAFGLAGDKSPFEGAWFIDSAVPAREFRERFQKAYGREITPGVGHSYDTIMLLAAAADRCALGYGSCSPEEFAEALRRIKDFPGSTGVVSVRSDGVIWTEAW